MIEKNIFFFSIQVPGAYYPVEMDYGEDTNDAPSLKLDEKSDLPAPVQKLILQIFDVNLMKQTLLEFDVTLLTIRSTVTCHLVTYSLLLI